MYLTSVTFLLQLYNLHLFFYHILEYDYRKTKGAIYISLIAILISGFSRIIFWKTILPVMYLVIVKIFSIIIPVLLFETKVIKGLLLSVNYNYVVFFLFSLFSKFLVHLDSSLQYINIPIISNSILLAIFFLCIKHKKIKYMLKKYINSLDEKILVFLLVVFYLLNWEGGIVSSNQHIRITLLFGKATSFSYIISIVTIISICLTFIISNKKKLLERNDKYTNEYIKNQEDYFKEMEANDEDIRLFKHDYRSHLLIMKEYVQNEEFDLLKSYLDSIETFYDRIKVVHTGNLVVDAIINKHINESDENVEFNIVGKIPSRVNIKPTDLCIIFSNLMSNAYEATIQCENNKNIDIVFSSNNDHLLITIDNPSNKAPISNGEYLLTTKVNKKQHGIGTRCIVETIKKYNGYISWNYDGNRVITKVII